MDKWHFTTHCGTHCSIPVKLCCDYFIIAPHTVKYITFQKHFQYAKNLLIVTYCEHYYTRSITYVHLLSSANEVWVFSSANEFRVGHRNVCCPSFRPSFHLSFRPSVFPFVCPSVHLTCECDILRTVSPIDFNFEMLSLSMDILILCHKDKWY